MQGGYYMEQNTQQDRAKLLEQQAREYLMRSDDPIFTQYVQQLIPRIQKQPQYVEQLQAELDKSVEYWHQRQKLNAERAESAAAGQIQESVQPSTQEPMQKQPIGQAVGQPAGQFTGQPTGQFAEQPRGQSTVRPAAETVVPGTKKKQNAEYLIGTIALSVARENTVPAGKSSRRKRTGDRGGGVHPRTVIPRILPPRQQYQKADRIFQSLRRQCGQCGYGAEAGGGYLAGG